MQLIDNDERVSGPDRLTALDELRGNEVSEAVNEPMAWESGPTRRHHFVDDWQSDALNLLVRIAFHEAQKARFQRPNLAGRLALVETVHGS